MNLKLKQLTIALCGLSLMSNLVYAAPSTSVNTNTSASQNNASSNSNSKTPTTSNSQTADDKIVLNFENADIQTVIKAISKLSGKNFVIDPRVKGTINIVSEKPISKSDSYKVLESALRMQGFATVEADGVIKVLPETDARTYGMKTDSQYSQKRNPGDQLVTKVFIIDNGSASQLANALRPIISPNNAISVYQNSNSLVVTDYASNMARITKIINDLKVTKVNRVPPVTVKLKYAYAGDVAQTLQSYLGNASGGGSSSGGGGGSNDGVTANVTVDSNSNSIIISSPIASKQDDLRNLALSLDRDASQNNNNLHVVYLKNADAAHVAEVLKVIATGQDNPDMTASSASRALSDTSSVFQGSGSGGSSGGSPFGSTSSGGNSGSGGNRPSSSNRSSGSTPGSNDKNAPKILIQAEPTTNSLIIQAPDAVYRNFRMVINMLDVRRVQIMIEVLVADVGTSEQGNFGIQWVGGAGNNNVGVAAVSNYAGANGLGGGSSSALSSIGSSIYAATQGASGSGGSGASGISIPNEFYVGVVTGTVTVGGQQIPAISTLADMLAANSAANVLARPTLLTLDNEEASIFVGQNIGVPSGSFQSTAGAPGNLATTVDRKDVGTIIRIKPLITQSGAIQMSLYEEDSKQDNGTMTAQLLQTNGPTFSKRNLKTQVIVDDGQIIALGGMTNDNVVIQSNGIPLLSSIPYLGWLFSWQNRIHQKENMLIFLRPVIIRNSEGYRALTNQRYRYIMDQQNTIKADGNILLPKIDAVNIENQVPYDNKIPAQPSPAVPSDPIVDLRSTTNNGKQSTTNQQQPYSNGSPTTGTARVIQSSPNAISITNN